MMQAVWGLCGAKSRFFSNLAFSEYVEVHAALLYLSVESHNEA